MEAPLLDLEGWLRDAGLVSGAAPTDAELKEAFGASTLTLGKPLSGPVDLAPLALFGALEELRVNDGLSLAGLPVLRRLRVLHAGRSPLPDALGARAPGLERASLVPLAVGLVAQCPKRARWAPKFAASSASDSARL